MSNNNEPWQINEYWSSARPGEKVLMLEVGEDEIQKNTQHRDFIRVVARSNQSTVIFKKKYDGESIVDAERDVVESFDPRFNPVVEQVPQDEHGFQTGTFTITVEWTPNDEA